MKLLFFLLFLLFKEYLKKDNSAEEAMIRDSKPNPDTLFEKDSTEEEDERRRGGISIQKSIALQRIDEKVMEREREEWVRKHRDGEEKGQKQGKKDKGQKQEKMDLRGEGKTKEREK